LLHGLSAGEAPAEPTELETATQAYELSRARYIRTVTSDAENKLKEAVAKRREALATEINSLVSLAHIRHETRSTTLRAYAARCPGRVRGTDVLPPPAGGAFNGDDKLYKAALLAADEFNELSDILRKRRALLEAIDGEMRTKLADYNRNLIAMLESPEGLANAFRRDPLLERAHQRMKAAQAAQFAAPAVAHE
jgi:hypothetical protein